MRMSWLRWRKVTYEIHGLMRTTAEIGRLSVQHLNSHDAQRPNVNFGAVLLTSNHLRGHPIWSPHERFPTRLVWDDASTEAKVWELHLNRKQGVGKGVKVIYLPHTLNIYILHYYKHCHCKKKEKGKKKTGKKLSQRLPFTKQQVKIILYQTAAKNTLYQTSEMSEKQQLWWQTKSFITTFWLTFPLLLSKILSLLTSRWITPWLCR